MRCPKCQYLGFEPSPRCKNCGYDFSFSGDDLQLTSAASEPAALGDLDLQIIEEPAQRPSVAPSAGFDLDELLSRDRYEPVRQRRSGGGAATAMALAVVTPPAEDVLRIVEEERASEPVRVTPVLVPVAAVRAPAASPAPAVQAPPAPPAPPRPIVAAAVAAAPAHREPVAAAPITTELPLFMQAISNARATQPPPVNDRAERFDAIVREEHIEVVDRPGMPLTIEDATDAGGPIDMMAAEQESSAEIEVDDRPLVQVPAVLRPPLAVRRTTPDPARLRAKYAKASTRTENSADSDLLRGIEDLEPGLQLASAPIANRLSAEPTPESLPAGWLQGVSAGKRLSAALVDAMLLGGINLAVIWLTLRVCGIGFSDARLLPIVPISLFFLLVDGGYMVLFTAACGQTIGKMAAGIRVVGTTTGAVINDRISIGQSVARAIGAIASCLPLGAGLWVSLLGDGRAFHDRIAHTRVVRA